MAHLIHTLDFAGPATELFEAFLRYFRSRNFHVEEADGVAMRLHAEKTGGLLSSLFGIGTLHIRVQFMDDDTVQIRLSAADAGTILEDLKRLAEASTARAEKLRNSASTASVAPPPMVVQQVVVREIVKIPCRFCGSLIENTQTRCPFCGGE